jgi:membrane protein YdbS with pleckstrin-like domain
MHATTPAAPAPPLAGLAIVGSEPRPHPHLMLYYGLASLLTGPVFPFVLLALWFRYRTLRYAFDEEGISMRWGILFRREISLTYARIQDIHLTSNVLERWLGLARIQIQTASGNAGAEMTIEGLPSHEAIRDFLYGRMRGARGAAPLPAGAAAARVGAGTGASEDAELAATLREVAAELRALRAEVDAGRPGTEGGDRA